MTRRALIAGDILVILLFALLALPVHYIPLSLGAVLREAGSLGISWFLLAPFLSTYRRPGWKSMLLNWGLAVPLGVWLRFMWTNQTLFTTAFFTFLAVNLALTLLLFLTWRLVFFAVQRRMA